MNQGQGQGQSQGQGQGKRNQRPGGKREQQSRTGDPDLKERLVGINRVAKTTKGGRTFSFSAIVVVGNENGKVGHGLGKSREVATAIQKGIEIGKKDMITVPVINGTIPHRQEMKYAGAHILIRPASPGTGVIAGGAMRAVLESAGIKNVLAKSLGSSNPHNVVKATFNALKELRDAKTIANIRGISMSKVFQG
ncbi:MAG TPA: 30S ribosomal protein S5 [Flavobacteriales bacterium]|jgi:small subunit ribosomal protein S5|nr:30S ribosomal protein S5 [Flavobacteriales bacterium]